MRTVVKTFKVYTFDELSDSAKQKAIECFHDINFYDDSFDWIYEDAGSIGLKIISFDIDKLYIDGNFTDYIDGVIPAILANHSETCETYKLAKQYEAKLALIEAEHNKTNDDDKYTDDRQALSDEFLPELLEVYLSILKKEYDYMISDEAIIETIRANEYEFLESGKQYY